MSFVSTDRPTPPDGDPVCDLATFADLAEVFGRARLLELWAAFEGAVARQFAPELSDGETIARDAHALVSLGGTLGFVGLSRACADVERICLTGGDAPAARVTQRGGRGRSLRRCAPRRADCRSGRCVQTATKDIRRVTGMRGRAAPAPHSARCGGSARRRSNQPAPAALCARPHNARRTIPPQDGNVKVNRTFA